MRFGGLRGNRKGGESPDGFFIKLQRLSRRNKNIHIRRFSEEAEFGHWAQHMLATVQDQEHSPVAERRHDLFDTGPVRYSQPDRIRQCRVDKIN
jgi:hypothetical protein